MAHLATKPKSVKKFAGPTVAQPAGLPVSKGLKIVAFGKMTEACFANRNRPVVPVGYGVESSQRNARGEEKKYFCTVREADGDLKFFVCVLGGAGAVFEGRSPNEAWGNATGDREAAGNEMFGLNEEFVRKHIEALEREYQAARTAPVSRLPTPIIPARILESHKPPEIGEKAWYAKEF
jgi:hypothetical protein